MYIKFCTLAVKDRSPPRERMPRKPTPLPSPSHKPKPSPAPIFVSLTYAYCEPLRCAIVGKVLRAPIVLQILVRVLPKAHAPLVEVAHQQADGEQDGESHTKVERPVPEGRRVDNVGAGPVRVLGDSHGTNLKKRGDGVSLSVVFMLSNATQKQSAECNRRQGCGFWCAGTFVPFAGLRERELYSEATPRQGNAQLTCTPHEKPVKTLRRNDAVT